MQASKTEGTTQPAADDAHVVREPASTTGINDTDQRLEALLEREEWTLLEEEGYGYGV